MKQYKLIISLFMAILSIASSTIHSKEIDGLYNISVDVSDQSEHSRQLAARIGLSEVIIRVSGKSAAANNLVIEDTLSESTSFIQRYSYRETKIVNEQNQLVDGLVLDLVFDEVALRKLLRKAGLPLWSSNRPQLLIWLAIGDEEQRFLMGSENEFKLNTINQEFNTEPEFSEYAFNESLTSTPSLTQTETNLSLDTEPKSPTEILNLSELISEKARERGLPVLIPLMDLEDSVNINVADVWGRFVMPIQQASFRYNSDAIVAGQIVKGEFSWITKWLLMDKGLTLSWQAEAESLEQAINSGLDIATDNLAEQYAVYEDSLNQQELLISISNIEQIEDFVALMSYLQNLTAISDVSISRVFKSTIYLRIKIISEQELLLQAIRLDKKLAQELAPEIDFDSATSKIPTLFFHWNIDGFR